jgi:acetylornithine/succinyldiaminopimelate/putrescine aminotransferase
LLLLFDEVQCGLGRTGELCGWRSLIPGDEIQPDAMSWAKSIGGGYPLGAFWVKDRPLGNGNQTRLCDLLGPGTHGTTYGGSPLACEVGLTTLDIIMRDELPQHAAALGREIAGEVTSWNHPLIREVRAFGMMIGFELEEEKIAALEDTKASGKPPSIYAAMLMLEAGLMVVPAGPKVLRWLPPLNTTRPQAMDGLMIFRDVLDDLVEV